MNLGETTFIFDHHTLDKTNGTAEFFYRLQTFEASYQFTETISFPTDGINWQGIPENLLQKALDNYLLMAGISYWKTTCAKNIQLPRTMHLTHKQADFWNTVYTKGLGEFFFTNSIDYRNLMNFPVSEQPETTPEKLIRQDRSLVFFGGGKDSIVSAELMKQQKKNFSLFMVNESDIQRHTAAVTGANVLAIKRTVDAKLIELNNQQGIFNGHVPISAIWAFLGVFAALLYDYRYLIVSNEKSANYGNVQYLGNEINHQWSKSEEFERLFKTYVSENMTPDITYFSLLRPLHEIKIAQLFTKYSQYYPYFSSCNKNFKINDPLTETKWCGKCSKCLFVFILLSAFLPKDTMLRIFGNDLYDDAMLLPLFQQLTGISSFKPFECVGTPEETLLALSMAIQSGAYEGDFLIEFTKKEVLPIIKNSATLKESLLATATGDTLPAAFANAL